MGRSLLGKLLAAARTTGPVLFSLLCVLSKSYFTAPTQCQFNNWVNLLLGIPQSLTESERQNTLHTQVIWKSICLCAHVFSPHPYKFIQIFFIRKYMECIIHVWNTIHQEAKNLFLLRVVSLFFFMNSIIRNHAKFCYYGKYETKSDQKLKQPLNVEQFLVQSRKYTGNEINVKF